MSTLTATIVSRAAGEPMRVSLAGTIDEDADLEGIFGQIDGDVVLDLGGVRRVNSIGVHRWINAMAAFAPGRRVVVEQCSYAVALQANCVANLMAGAEIHSCVAPYYCGECHQSEMVTIAAAELAADSAAPPEKPCPSCGSKLLFDELDRYFDFLRRAGTSAASLASTTSG